MNAQIEYANKITETVEFLKAAGIGKPQIGIVLGTGLGKMADLFENALCLDYSTIPNFPLSTVESHSGKLISGYLHNKSILAMQGRFHYYEGYSLQEITFPIRVMKKLGVQYLLLSNAAGALNLNFKKGTLMLINDHINLLPDNPLRGRNLDDYGPRFPDMSCPYSSFLNEKLQKIALRQKILLHSGVYVSVMGPNLETRAEYRMLRSFADAVGMSTVPEVIVANHMELPCAAVSVLTDECDPDHLEPAKLEDILLVAGQAEKLLIHLFSDLIREL
jgi:purine-nucleoside phosphorylase